jgi:basic membrane lipoprotein Med (substrate-binding protein (PBP1-ABC) superfamily)
MRLGVTVGLVLALLAAGCGGGDGGRKATPATTAATKTTATREASSAGDLRIGLVGPLTVDVAGVATEHGKLAQVADAPLVVVSARAASLAAVAAAARSHAASHFALVGESTKSDRASNLVGLVLGDGQAATLAGLVGGYAAADAGGTAPRVAWVGPQERPLANAFARGVHRALPAAVVLDEWSRSIPARCKEAALTAIGRGATVVMAHGGLCARAAIAGAHQQNVPGLQLGDFQFPGIAANLVARDAAAGVFHGGEDIVFGASSGAVGIGVLDPRISVATTVLARTAAQDLASGRRPAG